MLAIAGPKKTSFTRWTITFRSISSLFVGIGRKIAHCDGSWPKNVAAHPRRREPRPMPSPPSNVPATNHGPKIEIPPSPGGGKKQTPTPELEVPEVPPLKQTTLDDADPHSPAEAANINGQAKQATGVLASRYEGQTKTRIESEPSQDVLLSGEVVANGGGGPRMIVDIEPFDRSGHTDRFEGNISMMLVATDADGQHRSLARWDFSPHDVPSAMDPAANEPAMRFHLELPAGTLVDDDSTELWVRLAPTNGDKLLSHARVDLSQPGGFSSRTNKIWPSEESVVAASYVDTPTQPSDIAATGNEGKWATAQPGKPANLPVDPERAGGGWRASSEPLPAVVASATPAAPIHSGPQKSSDTSSTSTVTPHIAPKTSWSPERLTRASHDTAARPSWSATR